MEHFQTRNLLTKKKKFVALIDQLEGRHPSGSLNELDLTLT